MARSSNARVNRRIAKQVAEIEATQPVEDIAHHTGDETAADHAAVPASDGVVPTSHNEPLPLGIIPADVHVPTIEELRASFATDEEAEKLADESRGKRYTGVLLFAIANPTHVQTWDEHYRTYEAAKGNDKDKREVRAWFADMFGVPTPENMDAPERKARIDKIMANMMFVLALYRNGHLPHFSFVKAGAVFIDNDSDLGRAIYKANPRWADNDTLKKSGSTKIQIVDRKRQVIPGSIEWTKLSRMFTSAEAQADTESELNKVKTVGPSPAPTIATVSAANIAATFKDAIALRVANPPSGPNKFNDQKQTILDGIALIDMALSEIPQSEDEQKLFQTFKVAVCKLLNITPKPVASTATATPWTDAAASAK